jgi:hypothetical protein
VDELQPATNCAAQWSLNAIEMLALIPDWLPADALTDSPRPAGPRA